MFGNRSVSSYVVNGFMRALVKPALLTAARSGDFVGIRNRGVAVGERFSKMPAGVDRRDELIDDLPVSWISAANTNRDTVLLYLHGGGFVMPALGMHFAFCAKAALTQRLLVALPHYRLAPEHPFPAAPVDCFRAYQWLLNHHYAPENILLAGDSAGGNLVLATLLMAKRAGLPMPAGATLMSPGLRLNIPLSELSNDAIDPMFSVETLSYFKSAYSPGGSDGHDERLSPLLGDFTGLPPLQIIVGGAELLMPDSIEAAEKARACGVAVEFTLVEGLPHVFPLIDVLPEAITAQKKIFAFFTTCLAAAHSTQSAQSARSGAREVKHLIEALH